MAESITKAGKCPNCSHRIVKADKKANNQMFYAIKSMKIGEIDGKVVASCSNCKTDLVMPVMKIPAKITRPSNV